MLIKLDDLLLEFINPPKPTLKGKIRDKFRSQEVRKQELQKKMDRRQAVIDFSKSYVWREILRDRTVGSLRKGMGNLIRNGLKMSEVELKSEIATIREAISGIADLQYEVDMGEQAAKELERMK